VIPARAIVFVPEVAVSVKLKDREVVPGFAVSLHGAYYRSMLAAESYYKLALFEPVGCFGAKSLGVLMAVLPARL
jgi:hypothetical protein